MGTVLPFRRKDKKEPTSIYRKDEVKVFHWPDFKQVEDEFNRIQQANKERKDRQEKERNEANKKVLTNYRIK